MAVKTYNKESPVQPDILTGAMSCIESDHQMVHRYGMFTTTHVNSALADAGTVAIGLDVRTGFEIHVKHFGVTGEDFPWLFEASPNITYTESGTFLTPFNHHMQINPPESVVTVNLNPTALPASGGFQFLFGGGSGVGGASSSGQYDSKTEFIMHAGKHFIRVTNNTGSTAAISIVLTWYELDLT